MGNNHGAKRDSLPRNEEEVWGIDQAWAVGNGLRAKRDSFPA
jgi:hypothetical protein